MQLTQVCLQNKNKNKSTKQINKTKTNPKQKQKQITNKNKNKNKQNPKQNPKQNQKQHNKIGWVTDENPVEKAKSWAKQTNFIAPLDEIEGAARVLDPIFVGINEKKRPYGKFLKDYRETDW